ncbi:alpha/beta hydrolase [Acinetobacter pittii]|uniref:alpha/beta hydrolase n=1 Tax=Acinetobacter pittii TaxID=48296 RepID=UPI001EFE562B|nr:alpha/beta hydrolase [Acinetobacter pittii]MCG9481179.1 alpha/beta hydrolase [Acinetobacter pittii]
MESVAFKNRAYQMAGNLYFPANFDKKNKYAAVVCVHPASGVKEQTAGLYANKIADKGFITLSFDASFQGESQGEPRGLEDPYTRVEDIRAAIDYLCFLSFVDNHRIGVLGICAGGAYAMNTAITDHRIKAAVGVNSVNIGAMFRNGWDGKAEPSNALPLLNNVALQRTAEANGAPLTIAPWSPESIDGITDPEMLEAYSYYRTARGQHPNSNGKGLLTALGTIVGYDAFHLADLYLTQPILIIAGREAQSRWNSERLFDVAASNKKELFIVDGASHFDLYDKPLYVNQAVEKIIPFFQKHL